MAVSLLASKILAAGAGALAGYLLYKPEKKQGGNNGGQSKDAANKDSVKYSELVQSYIDERRAEYPCEFGRVLDGTVIDERVNRPYYFGDRNKPYDPFYDYTDFQNKGELLESGMDPFRFCRARIIPEFFSYSERYVRALGWQIKVDKNEFEGFFVDAYTPQDQFNVDGFATDIRFRVEVFNPSILPVPISKLGISSITLNGEPMGVLRDTYLGDVDKGNEAIDDRKDKKNWAVGFHYNGQFYEVGQTYRTEKVGDQFVSESSGESIISISVPYGLLRLKETAWGGFAYPYSYTPETIPAQGSFFQDWFLSDLYTEKALATIYKAGMLHYKYNFKEKPYAPKAYDGAGSLEVKLFFASGESEGILDAALYRGERPSNIANNTTYYPEYIGSLLPGLFNPSQSNILLLWDNAKDLYNAAFDSSYGVDMAAYWYLWAENKARLESKIRSILGVNPDEFDSTTPARRLQMLKNEYYQNATSEQKQELNNLLTLWRNTFKSPELSVTDAENTYKETYNNDVTKGVTLLPSLKYWAEQADGAAPESIAPGTSSRTSNPNRNAVPDYRDTSAGTSTSSRTTTTENTGSGLTRGGSSTTTTTTTTGTSTRSVNGVSSGYNAVSM